MRNLLGYLLFLANTNPEPHRITFYAMKDRLLRRYGTLIGEDLQEITKECWGCHGTGVWESWDSDRSAPCNRCEDGIFDHFFVVLERWELGNWRFHRPVQHRSTPKYFGQDANIVGYVEHSDMGRRAIVAKWLLFALFDRGPVWCRVNSWDRKLEVWKWRIKLWRNRTRYRQVLDDDIPF